MPEPPHRKRFQIHLSTAIVMMFVAGALMWANTRERGMHSLKAGLDSVWTWSDFGWPYDCLLKKLSIVKTDGEVVDSRTDWNWNKVTTTFNTLTASLILASTGFLCEWLIRRATPKGS